MGRKKLPFYRIVAVDSRKRRDGAPLEVRALAPGGSWGEEAAHCAQLDVSASPWGQLGGGVCRTVRSWVSIATPVEELGGRWGPGDAGWPERRTGGRRPAAGGTPPRPHRSSGLFFYFADPPLVLVACVLPQFLGWYNPLVKEGE